MGWKEVWRRKRAVVDWLREMRPLKDRRRRRRRSHRWHSRSKERVQLKIQYNSNGITLVWNWSCKLSRQALKTPPHLVLKGFTPIGQLQCQINYRYTSEPHQKTNQVQKPASLIMTFCRECNCCFRFSV